MAFTLCIWHVLTELESLAFLHLYCYSVFGALQPFYIVMKPSRLGCVSVPHCVIEHHALFLPCNHVSYPSSICRPPVSPSPPNLSDHYSIIYFLSTVNVLIILHCTSGNADFRVPLVVTPPPCPHAQDKMAFMTEQYSCVYTIHSLFTGWSTQADPTS